VKDHITEINKLAEVIECVKAQVDPALLIGIDKFNLEHVIEFDPEFLRPEPEHTHEHAHDGSCPDPDFHKHEHDHDGACPDPDFHKHGHDHVHDEKKASDGHDHGHGHNHEEKKGHDHGHGHDHEEKKEHGHGHGHGHEEEPKAKKKKAFRHDMHVSSVGITLTEDEHMNLGGLQNWIGELMQTKGSDLYRYKGILSVIGFDRKFVFQGVHEMFDGDFMEEWKEGEKRISKFVFIGKDLKREELEEGFRKCI